MDVEVRNVPNAEMYAACAEGRHQSCPAGRPNGIPVHGRCDCACHAPLPPV
jgi:hypothetical protein